MIRIIFVGMDEMEFTEAESNMNDLIAEYQTYQVKKKNIFFSPWPISLTFGTTQPQNILYFFWLALSQLSGKV